MSPDILTLLNALQSPNHDERTAAEAQYDQLGTAQKCEILSSILADSSVTVQTRCFVAVLLRRLLLQTSNKESKEKIGLKERDTVLQLLLEKNDDTLRKRICDVVSEFARMYTVDDEENGWTEILPKLFALADSNEPGQKLSALNILTNFPGIFGNKLDRYSGVIQQLLLHCMSHDAFEIQKAAAIAYASCVKEFHNYPTVYKEMRQNSNAYLSVVVRCMYEETDNPYVLESMEEMLEEVPNFIRPHLDEFGSKALEALNCQDVTSESKHQIIEILLTLSEMSCKMFLRRFCPNHLVAFVRYLLRTMCDIDDENESLEEWADTEVADDTDEMTDNIFAETGLDRLSTALGSSEGGQRFLEITLDTVNSMLASNEWKEKVAGLLALSAIGEGSRKTMLPMLSQLVDGVLTFLNDPNPRVRYAACNALGQMSDDFQPQLQKNRHSVVFPALLRVMDDGSCAKVQAHAAAALLNLITGCPMSVFRRYLDTVVASLEKLLNEKYAEFLKFARHVVLEQIVTTISTVADIAEEEFQPYYSRFIGTLLKLLSTVASSDYHTLHGKVIECISLIGATAGKDQFMRDCEPMISDLVKIKLDTEAAENDELEMTFVLAAWSRLCVLLGQDFAQYLPIVFEPLMKAASFRPQIAVVAEDEAKGLEEETDDWEFLSLGDQQSFGIRTTGLEYKANACLLLSCCARELKEAFLPYVDRVVELMIPLLRFYFFDSVRSAAADSLPNLLGCVASDGDRLLKMWQMIRPELLNAVVNEPDVEVCGQLLSSLAKVMEILYPSTLSPGDLDEITKALLDRLEKYLENQEENKCDLDEEDEDKTVDDDDGEMESLVVNKMSDVVHTSFQVMKEHYLPYFERILPILEKLLAADRPHFERQWIICCFDDAINFTGPASFKYSSVFLQPMFNMIKDPHPEVRQAVSYGIGLMAQYGGEHYIEFVKSCINPLLEVIAAPDSRSDDNEMATENAISAITKAMLSSAFTDEDRHKMLPLWLRWLPTYEDHDESEYIYGYLCLLIESGNQTVLGRNNENMPILMNIFAECFLQDGIDLKRDTARRMSHLIKQVQANEELSCLCKDALSDEKKLALQRAVEMTSA